MRRLAPGLVAVGLLLVSCVIPPIAYNDGLPAATPAPGVAAARFEYSRFYWWRGDHKMVSSEYFGGGLRFGQDWRRLCFEEGLTLLCPGWLLPCLQAGVGLRNPAVTLRALWTPVGVGSSVTFDPMLWWQISALAGTPRKSQGLGLSGGARTGRLGIGPMAVLDYTHRGISFRLEGSMTFRPPWSDSAVQGRVLTIGLVAEPTKEISGK